MLRTVQTPRPHPTSPSTYRHCNPTLPPLQLPFALCGSCMCRIWLHDPEATMAYVTPVVTCHCWLAQGGQASPGFCYIPRPWCSINISWQIPPDHAHTLPFPPSVLPLPNLNGTLDLQTTSRQHKRQLFHEDFPDTCPALSCMEPSSANCSFIHSLIQQIATRSKVC